MESCTQAACSSAHQPHCSIHPTSRPSYTLLADSSAEARVFTMSLVKRKKHNSYSNYSPGRSAIAQDLDTSRKPLSLEVTIFTLGATLLILFAGFIIYKLPKAEVDKMLLPDTREGMLVVLFEESHEHTSLFYCILCGLLVLVIVFGFGGVLYCKNHEAKINADKKEFVMDARMHIGDLTNELEKVNDDKERIRDENKKVQAENEKKCRELNKKIEVFQTDFGERQREIFELKREKEVILTENNYMQEKLRKELQEIQQKEIELQKVLKEKEQKEKEQKEKSKSFWSIFRK